ncbi:helix-turn-helix transcriptional regulator [Streptomyces sp. NPDC002225]|uniref:helix-turn-helix domain-containing protein n=1 Tax=Streptomyces sp. NPDC002225 TaxID=3154413 RepID=UPI00332DCC82
MPTPDPRPRPATHKQPRPGPATDPERAARCAEAVRNIAEDFVVVSEALLRSAYGDTATSVDLLRIIASLAALSEEATAAVVVGQRSRGESLHELAPVLNRTEDRLRKKYEPEPVDRALAVRVRPLRTAPTTRPPNADAAPVTGNRLREPRQRLACALTLLKKRSGVSQRALAHKMNVDPSYVSRMLSGERDVVDWRYVVDITEMCGGNLDLMRPLWETAAHVQPTGDDPIRYLRTYLRALRYAAGSPSDRAILKSAQHTIAMHEFRQAFEGPGLPDWQVVAQLTTALWGLPETARPLWRRARSIPGTGCTTIPAEAFG